MIKFPLLILMILFLVCPEIRARENSFKLKTHAAYSTFTIRNKTDPVFVKGAGATLNGTYNFNDTYGLSLDIGYRIHQNYKLENIPNEPLRKRSQTGTVAVTLVYVIDTMKVIPYIALGVVNGFLWNKLQNSPEFIYNFGYRFDLGLDYKLKESFYVGMTLNVDNFLLTSSDFASLITLGAGITYVFTPR